MDQKINLALQILPKSATVNTYDIIDKAIEVIHMKFNTIEEGIEDIKKGKMVILVDDEPEILFSSTSGVWPIASITDWYMRSPVPLISGVSRRGCRCTPRPLPRSPCRRGTRREARGRKSLEGGRRARSDEDCPAVNSMLAAATSSSRPHRG